MTRVQELIGRPELSYPEREVVRLANKLVKNPFDGAIYGISYSTAYGLSLSFSFGNGSFLGVLANTDGMDTSDHIGIDYIHQIPAFYSDPGGSTTAGIQRSVDSEIGGISTSFETAILPLAMLEKSGALHPGTLSRLQGFWKPLRNLQNWKGDLEDALATPTFFAHAIFTPDLLEIVVDAAHGLDIHISSRLREYSC